MLADVIARALAGGNLDELSGASDDELLDAMTCFRIRGIGIPDELRARGETLTGADRTAFAVLLGEQVELPVPPDGDFEQLAAWAVEAAAFALPGTRVMFGREEDLVRGVGFALLSRDAYAAARLLRWLALSVPLAELREPLEDTIQLARHTGRGLIAALIARSLARPARAKPPALPRNAPVPVHVAPKGVFLDRALGWIETHLERFASPDRDAVPAAVIARYKAIGELALVASHVTAAGEPWIDRGRALTAFAIAQLGDGERLATLVESAPPLAVFATILPALHRVGFTNARLDAAISRHAGTVSRDLAYFVGTDMRAIGLQPPWDLELAWSWTRIVRAPWPWRMPPAELYLLLHEVWYRAAAGWPDDRGRAYITRWLPVWLRHVEKIGHHDLLAELVITWQAVYREPAPPAAWNVLVAAQRDDGSVPTTRANASAGHDIMTDEYHATLNAIWAAATS